MCDLIARRGFVLANAPHRMNTRQRRPTLLDTNLLAATGNQLNPALRLLIRCR